MQLGGRFLTEHDLKDAGFRKLGKNVKIHERASIYCTENISIGDNVQIGDFSIIIASGFVEIGSRIDIANYAFLGGSHGIVLEDFVTITHGVKIFSASADYSGEFLNGPNLPEEFKGDVQGKVTIRKHTIIGSNSIVFPGCTIGEGVAIGAMSLVTKDLDPWGIYVGVPAKRLKERKKDLLLLEKQLIVPESLV